MFTRSVAACLSFLAVATAAQAGVLRAEVDFILDNPGPYEGGETIAVNIFVRQVAMAGKKDRLLRYAQFDFSDTHPDLLAGLSLPVTHDRVGTANDIHFWHFESQVVCPGEGSIDPMCGAGHLIEDELGGQRPGLVAIFFLGDLTDPEYPDPGENPNWQLPLPGDQSWLKIGTVEVTLPEIPGFYLLDVLNPDDPHPEMGGQLRWGFGLDVNDPVTAWRASAGEIEGGALIFCVGACGECEEACGDGHLDITCGEECDDGNSVNEDDCLNSCVLNTCGDSFVDLQGPETDECDDGGESATCDADCTMAECGDSTLNATAGEECDDGPGNSDSEPDACRTTCLLPSCGDAVVDTGEECDDGNNVDGDGCSSTCMLEGACCRARGRNTRCFDGVPAMACTRRGDRFFSGLTCGELPRRACWLERVE